MSTWPHNQIEKNKYWHQYHRLMQKARERGELTHVYVEWHHVVPVAFTQNRKTECVCLTYAEHFRAHELLVKFCTGQAKAKMWNALSKMTQGRKGKVIITSRQYAIARKAAIEKFSDPKHIANIKIAMNNYWRDPELRAKACAERKARYDDPSYYAKTRIERKARWTNLEHRAKQIAERKARQKDPKYRARHADQIKAKHADPKSGYNTSKNYTFYQTPEYKAKCSASHIIQWQDQERLAKMTATIRKKVKDPKFIAKLRAGHQKHFQKEHPGCTSLTTLGKKFRIGYRAILRILQDLKLDPTILWYKGEELQKIQRACTKYKNLHRGGKGSKWITNGKISRHLAKNKSLPRGWFYGRTLT